MYGQHRDDIYDYTTFVVLDFPYFRMILIPLH